MSSDGYKGLVMSDRRQLVTTFLASLGEDPEREGLQETPERFLKAWEFYTSGYNRDPAAVLKTFEDGAENVDGMIVQTDIPVYSHCEHHLAPFFGVAHIGYIPTGKVVGLSKLKRLVDVYARRLQVQERLTQQIAEAFNSVVQPKAVGVILQCRHMCMESRGINTAGSATTTASLLGVFYSDSVARSEFLHHVKSSSQGLPR